MEGRLAAQSFGWLKKSIETFDFSSDKPSLDLLRPSI